ncbi:hypothetical protein CBER1_11179 [Cercospora berteroae]|uniref:Myb-like domain-containing protein n=1 Tax=Cercospora berteroae TaxID=357750 RepID=A0A2S6CAE8_9PEZI|nr:hypothetical protein CBER1_11179 [Cercospora berteroae]
MERAHQALHDRFTTTATNIVSSPVANDIHRPAPVEARCLSGELWQPPCSVAAVARPYDFPFDFSGHGPEQNNTEVPPVTQAEYQQLLQGFDHSYLQPQQPQQNGHDYAPYGSPGVLLPQEQHYALDQVQPQQQQMLAQQKPRQFSQVSAAYSSYQGTPYQSPPSIAHQSKGIPNAQPSRKRSYHEEYTYEYPALQQLQAHASSGTQMPVELTPQGQHAQLQTGAVSYQYQPQRSSSAHSHSHSSTPQQTYAAYQQQQAAHHHHRLPNQQPPNKIQRIFGRETPEDDEHGPPSVVGQPGMPEPAPRPKGPKLKFTPEDDALLVELKETKNLTWKQIADFFPGRSSGTLQVRYCTKLKAKTTIWTDDMVQRLQSAMQEYEADRWRIISGKVGNGFSATACKEKAMELDAPEMEDSEFVRPTPQPQQMHMHYRPQYHDGITTATNFLQHQDSTASNNTATSSTTGSLAPSSRIHKHDA